MFAHPESSACLRMASQLHEAWLATSHVNNDVCLWDMSTGRNLKKISQSIVVNDILFTPAGLAVALGNRTVLIYDVQALLHLDSAAPSIPRIIRGLDHSVFSLFYWDGVLYGAVHDTGVVAIDLGSDTIRHVCNNKHFVVGMAMTCGENVTFMMVPPITAFLAEFEEAYYTVKEASFQREALSDLYVTFGVCCMFTIMMHALYSAELLSRMKMDLPSSTASRFNLNLKTQAAKCHLWQALDPARYVKIIYLPLFVIICWFLLVFFILLGCCCVD